MELFRVQILRIYGKLDFDIKIRDWLTFSSVNDYKYINSSSQGYSDPRSSSAKIKWASHRVESRSNPPLYQPEIINKERLGKHSISGLIAYEFDDYYYKNLDVYGTGFVRI